MLIFVFIFSFFFYCYFVWGMGFRLVFGRMLWQRCHYSSFAFVTMGEEILSVKKILRMD